MIRMRLASLAVQSQQCNILSRGGEPGKSKSDSRLQCCAHTYARAHTQMHTRTHRCTHAHTHTHTHTHTHKASSSSDVLAMANSDDKTDRPTNFLITAPPYLLLRPNCIRHRHGLFLVALLFLICLNSTNSIRCSAPEANRIRAWVTQPFILLNTVRDRSKERSTCQYQ